MAKPGLNINAEVLYRKSNTHQIKQITDEIYKTITHMVTEAQQSGASEVYFNLPDTFQAGSLEPADIQLCVYSRLIEMVEGNDLKVGLIRTPEGGSQLHIKWPSILDPTEKARMKKIIMDHLELTP